MKLVSRFYPFPYIITMCFVLMYASHGAGKERLLTIEAARSIVNTNELAREAAKDRREESLLSKEIVGTAVADLGRKSVVFNRVPMPQKLLTTHSAEPRKVGARSEILGLSRAASLSQVDQRAHVAVFLSGYVYEDGISELWWMRDGVHYRVFVNANLLGLEYGDYAGDTAIYSVFPAIVAATRKKASGGDRYPKASEFTTGELEYIAAEWGEAGAAQRLEVPNLDEYQLIDAILAYYADNHAVMHLHYENSEILHTVFLFERVI